MRGTFSSPSRKVPPQSGNSPGSERALASSRPSLPGTRSLAGWGCTRGQKIVTSRCNRQARLPRLDDWEVPWGTLSLRLRRAP